MFRKNQDMFRCDRLVFMSSYKIKINIQAECTIHRPRSTYLRWSDFMFKCLRIVYASRTKSIQHTKRFAPRKKGLHNCYSAIE